MASDGVYYDLLTLLVDVEILNDSPPQLSLAGRLTANFVENATSPAPIGTIHLTCKTRVFSNCEIASLGMVYQPLITDADNNAVFGLESATVTLLDAPDSADESISISDLTVQGLSALGIVVTGKTSMSSYQVSQCKWVL